MPRARTNCSSAWPSTSTTQKSERSSSRRGSGSSEHDADRGSSDDGSVAADAAECRNDPDGSGAERQDENRSEYQPCPAAGEVERRAVSGDLGHPQARIRRIAVDDAVPALEATKLAGPLELAMQRLERTNP